MAKPIDESQIPAVSPQSPLAPNANAALAAAMAKYGVVASEVRRVDVESSARTNLLALCDRVEPYVVDGVLYQCQGHSDPLMVLTAAEERDSDTFDGSDKYLSMRVFHPLRGEVVLSYGAATSKESDLYLTLLDMRPGSIFCVGRVATAKKGQYVFVQFPVAA